MSPNFVPFTFMHAENVITLSHITRSISLDFYECFIYVPFDCDIVRQPGYMLIVVLLTMTCISYETHQGECCFSIRGTRCGLSPLWSFSTSVGGADDFPTLTMFSVW